MIQTSIFDSEIALPSAAHAKQEKTLLGFEARYARVHDQLRLLLNASHCRSGTGSSMGASLRSAPWWPSNIRS
jgi:hypothetical protein